MNQDCYKKAIKLLTKREYSRLKLEEKLIASGCTQEDSNLVVEKLYTLGLLKENWYIETKIKNMMRKGYSKQLIQQRLSFEKLEVELSTIENIFDHFSKDESHIIEHLIDKKAQRYLPTWEELGPDQQQKIKAKLIRSVLAKGYSLNEGISAVDSYFHTK